MNQIPQAGQLFIGGLRALDRPDLLEEAKITHILSVLEFDYCDYEEFGKYDRLLIQVEDHPRENILGHLSQCNDFLDRALAGGGNVLVHCAMGVSRSATVVCAYLMYKQSLSPEEALRIVREARPLCNPNDGFMEQLDVYHRMLKARSDVDAGKIYSDWSQKRNDDSKM